ncbi:tetratricopeptide repeat protein [Hyalangium sp.]|uniref:tetratricopeptide repeat protein n=1 Tax=Hyalangium sp. TaxID=2028555 RepID=UPI002D6774E4|nr:tetratricopeptide repeat protein [Hyalangium sp.]HYI00750.1 tetratricopeptide repeat protein [Hyalangium sp.]
MSSLIHSRSECWRLSVLLCALWVLAPWPAAGAEPAAEARAQARVKFNDGNAAYEQGDFRRALEAFEAAYELVPLSGFLFNVAQCHRQLGDFARAASSYRRYLALSEKEPANAAMVKELIAEMDAKAKQQTASRAAPRKHVAQAKAVAKDRPEAHPARPLEEQGGVKKEGGGLKEAEQRALEPRRSRSVGQKSLPPAAVPSTSVQEEREPLTRKWWVWAGAGAAAVVAGGIIYAVTAPDPRPTTLGTIPGR